MGPIPASPDPSEVDPVPSPSWRTRLLLAVAVAVVGVLVAFTLYFRVQWGSVTWWGRPGRIDHCGQTYTYSGTTSPDDEDLSDLEERFTVPPFRRRVLVRPTPGRPCPRGLFLRLSPDHYVTYIGDLDI